MNITAQEWRLTVTELARNRAGLGDTDGRLQFASLVMRLSGVEQPWAGGATATADPATGFYPTNEEPAKIVDNNPGTKTNNTAHDLEGGVTSFVIDNGAAITGDEFVIVTANDQPGGDPYYMTLDAKLNGAWVRVGVVNSANAQFTATRGGTIGPWTLALLRRAQVVQSMPRPLPRRRSTSMVYAGQSLVVAPFAVGSVDWTAGPSIRVIVPVTAQDAGPGDVLVATPLLFLRNDFTLTWPVSQLGAGKSIAVKIAAVAEGDPPAIGTLSTTATIADGRYSATFTQAALQAALGNLVGDLVAVHLDDGAGFHAAKTYRVADLRAFGD